MLVTSNDDCGQCVSQLLLLLGRRKGAQSMGVGEETEGVSRAFLVLHHHSGISALYSGAVTSLVIQLNEPDISSCNSPSEGDSEGVVGTCLQSVKLEISEGRNLSSLATKKLPSVTLHL